ncbi:MAG: Trm112 family protein [Chthonomonadales bacterium]|nr:Trm112 family protein [Chthonomonadales bacterium]
MIDEQLLALLACPACDDRPPVRQEGETLVCERCGRIYPIREGIPDMLVESAVLPGESVPDPKEKESGT